MKNLLLTLALSVGCISYSAAQVQIDTRPQTSADVGMSPIKQGNWMVGGSVGSLGYSFESKSFNINLSPRAGYFVTDGLAIGAQANLGLRTVDEGDNEWGYGIAPFVRYYFLVALVLPVDSSDKVISVSVVPRPAIMYR